LERFEAMGVELHGEVWVMGGFTSANLAVTSRVDIYAPQTNTWRRGPELPAAETHAGTFVVGDDLYLAGGLSGFPGNPIRSVHMWNGTTWEELPDLPAPRAAMALVMVDGALHAVAGLAEDGNSDSNAHTVLRPGVDSAWSAAAPLPNARNHLGGAAVGNTLFIVGGRHGWDEANGHQGSMHALDAVTGAWRERAPVPRPRSEIGASTFSVTGGLVVIGGSIQNVTPTDSVALYDAATDVWRELPPLPEPRKGAVAVRVGAQIIVTTGSPTSTDPSTTTWVGCCL